MTTGHLPTERRVDVDDSLTKRMAKRLAADPGVRVIQTVAPLGTSTLALLDERIFANRADVQFRVYGHYGSECDLGLVRYVPNVKSFAADSLRTAINVDAIAELRHLESLSLGVDELDSFRVLDAVPSGLRSLSLGRTRSKKPSLDHLQRFSSLRTLRIEGQQSGIAAVSHLRALEDLSLRSVTTPDVEFLAGLDQLRSLDMKLGGTTNLAAIEGMTGIRYLELWQVRGMTNVDVLGTLTGLQYLFLQSLPQVRKLPSFDALTRLRRVVLENMRGLGDFTGFETAPALEEFALIDGRHLQPDQLLPILRNPAVRLASAGFGSRRKNDWFDRLRAEHGKWPLEDWTFDYS